MRKAHPVAGEPIEIGRADNRMAVTAEVIPAMVVRNNDQEVRRPLLGAQGDRQNSGKQSATSHEATSTNSVPPNAARCNLKDAQIFRLIVMLPSFPANIRDAVRQEWG